MKNTRSKLIHSIEKVTGWEAIKENTNLYFLKDWDDTTAQLYFQRSTRDCASTLCLDKMQNDIQQKDWYIDKFEKAWVICENYANEYMQEKRKYLFCMVDDVLVSC